ncbi:MAG: SUMF1/EgtB/PvdO family nonheme iron enzyme [Nitrospira sp.]|nr:SUMF1/EgtB/PvdO family nonheme iron enzyme [Nitrospira sp.]
MDDGFEVAAPVGRVKSDASPYGVMDGAGNVMEWVNDWYLEGPMLRLQSAIGKS